MKTLTRVCGVDCHKGDANCNGYCEGRAARPSTFEVENSAIENAFRYHAPKPGQPEKYEALRAKAKELAYLIDELCPAGREKSKAMTELQDSVMWANAAIACAIESSSTNHPSTK